jgi:nitrogen fixation protein NifB
MIARALLVDRPHAATLPHPCFHPEGAGKFGRIHLPVAPRCNVQCAYCSRSYDCAHESRPGVTSTVLGPRAAADHLDDVLRRMPWISVAGIAGPGDAFAQPLRTLATLELIRRRHPGLHLCLSTNGLGIGEHIEVLAELKVGFVTITVNTVNPEIGARLYSWIDWKGEKMAGTPAASLLLDRQLEAIARLKAKAVAVKVNTVVIPGVNDDHVPAIAAKIAGLGVDLHNLIAMIPIPGTPLDKVPSPSPSLMASLRRAAEWHLPQMHHCMRCRADAAGLLTQSSPCKS